MLMVLMIFRPQGLLTAETAREQEEPDLAAPEPEPTARI